MSTLIALSRLTPGDLIEGGPDLVIAVRIKDPQHSARAKTWGFAPFTVILLGPQGISRLDLNPDDRVHLHARLGAKNRR